MSKAKKGERLKRRSGLTGFVLGFVWMLALGGPAEAGAWQGRAELGGVTRAYSGDVHDTSRYNISWQAVVEQNYIEALSFSEMVVMWGLQGGQAAIEHNYARMVITHAGAVATGYYPMPRPFRRLSLALRFQGGGGGAKLNPLSEVAGSLSSGMVVHSGLGAGLVLEIAYGVQLTTMYAADLFFFGDGVVVGHGLQIGLGYGRKF